MEFLLQNLNQVRWRTDMNNIQEMSNLYKPQILTIVDKIVAIKEVGNAIKRKVSKTLKSKLNR
jgi:hypothetical protein